MDLKGFVQYIPKVDNTLTLEGECADAKVTGDKFNEMDDKKVNTSDIVNDLVTGDADKPLSAGMGKELKKNIDEKKADGVSYDNTESGLTSQNMQGAIDELKKNQDDSTTVQTVNLCVEPNVDCTKSVCHKFGKVCIVVFDFTTKQEISASGVPIFADLPKPKSDVTFEVHCMDNKTPYWLGVYGTGHLSTAYVSNIPANTRLFGAFTYIAE